jgi:hypothetical protein
MTSATPLRHPLLPPAFAVLLTCLATGIASHGAPIPGPRADAAKAPGTPAALAIGSAKGSITVNGASTPFRHAYARFNYPGGAEYPYDIDILFTSSAISERQLANWVEGRDYPTAEGDAWMVNIGTNEDLAVRYGNFIQNSTGTTVGFSDQVFALRRIDATTIAGTAHLEQPRRVESKDMTIDYRVEFAARIRGSQPAAAKK